MDHKESPTVHYISFSSIQEKDREKKREMIVQKGD